MPKLSPEKAVSRHLSAIEKMRDAYLFLLDSATAESPLLMKDIPTPGLSQFMRKQLSGTFAKSVELGILGRAGEEGKWPRFYVIDRVAIERLRFRDPGKAPATSEDRDASFAVSTAVAPIADLLALRIEESLGALSSAEMDRFMQAVRVQVDEEIERGAAELRKLTEMSLSEISKAMEQLSAQQRPAPVLVAVPKEPAKPAAPAKPRLPRVCVVGLLPSQTRYAKEGFDDCLDLRFFSIDTSPQQLSSAFAECDVAVLMTKFINHSVTNAAKKAPEHRLCPGGISGLREVLTDIYVNGARSAA
jgi:hypothetical protein